MLTQEIAVLFTFYQIVVFTTLYIIVCGYQLIPTESQSLFSAKDFLIPALATSYSFITRICLQPLMACFCYLILIFINTDSTEFADYKQIPSDYIIANSDLHYTLIGLVTICLLENLLINICRIFFFTDYTLLRVYIWATNDWQSPLLELIMKLYLSAIFILDPHDSAITGCSIAASLGYLLLISLRFYKTISAYLLADLTELFYETLTACLYIFICIYRVFF